MAQVSNVVICAFTKKGIAIARNKSSFFILNDIVFKNCDIEVHK